MSDNEVLIAIAVMSVVVLISRIGGYVLGLGFSKTTHLQKVLDVLPGCAMMALIVPGAMKGSLTEVVALLVTVSVMWKTGSVAVATLLGLGILLVSSVL